MRPTAKTLALVAARDSGRCAWCGGEVSGRRGEDFSLHHRRPAGMGGDRRPETHGAGNLVLLHGSGTTGCHGAVESQRAYALAKGFLISKLSAEHPSTWPIQHAVHGWCYLLDDGTWSTKAVAA